MDSQRSNEDSTITGIPTVVCAAILYDGQIYSLPPPARHHDVIAYMVKNYGFSFVHHETQGFMLSDGTFANRARAMQIAISAGQVIRDEGPGLYNGPDLYSEDLW